MKNEVKEIKKELEEAIGIRKETPAVSKEEIQKIEERVSRAIKTEKLLKEVVSSIKEIDIDVPDKVEVKNFPKKIEISNFPKQERFPKKIKIEKPDWYNEGDPEDITIPITKVIQDSFKQLTEQVSSTYVTNQNPEDAIAVRLTTKDARTFYDAIQGAFASVAPRAVAEVETTPLDSTKNNPNFVLSYTGSNLTTVQMIIGGVTYTKTLSYTGDNLTAVSKWS